MTSWRIESEADEREFLSELRQVTASYRTDWTLLALRTGRMLKQAKEFELQVRSGYPGGTQGFEAFARDLISRGARSVYDLIEFADDVDAIGLDEDDLADIHRTNFRELVDEIEVDGFREEREAWLTRLREMTREEAIQFAKAWNARRAD